MKKLVSLVGLAVFAVAFAARAGVPLQVGLAGESAQLFAAETPVTGLRVNLPYGENAELTGLDFGIAGGGGTVRGIRLNLLNLSSVRSAGVELGLINMDEGSFSGIQFGAFNIVEGEVHGWQTGLFNNAGELHGFQLGVFNRAGSLHGVQIGLLNVVKTGKVTMLPLVGWGF